MQRCLDLTQPARFHGREFFLVRPHIGPRQFGVGQLQRVSQLAEGLPALFQSSDGGGEAGVLIETANEGGKVIGDNPFSAARGGGDRGLARVSAPGGTLILYATKPGETASDNPGGVSGRS